MARSKARASPRMRAARRWVRRFVYVASRALRIVILAGAAMGPTPPPPPPPEPAKIEASAEERVGEDGRR